jgi:hypothetical protein
MFLEAEFKNILISDGTNVAFFAWICIAETT